MEHILIQWSLCNVLSSGPILENQELEALFVPKTQIEKI